MESSLLIALLLAFIAGQQFFFLRQIQKLVDKIMSRSFTEYVMAKEPQKPKISVPLDEPEDLRTLQEFSL